MCLICVCVCVKNTMNTAVHNWSSHLLTSRWINFSLLRHFLWQERKKKQFQTLKNQTWQMAIKTAALHVLSALHDSEIRQKLKKYIRKKWTCLQHGALKTQCLMCHYWDPMNSCVCHQLCCLQITITHSTNINYVHKTSLYTIQISAFSMH